MNLGPQTVSSTYQFVLNQSGTSITLGNGSGVNWDAAGVVMTTGDQYIGGTKEFTSRLNSSSHVDLGYGLNLSNNFGTLAQNNFGFFSTTNTFGSDAEENYFGVSYFDASANIFGQGSINTYYSGRFEGPIRLRLSQFSGVSNQAGQQGELRISGNYLYVCTGVSSGWNRILLSTFI